MRAGFPEQWREILLVPSSAPRTRGCSGGRKPKDPNALAQALLMYNSREYTIAQITEETHISTSTLYKYIHLQEPSQASPTKHRESSKDMVRE
ncbi:MAG: helix-turn-helix domain-containing protein [Coriobacteriales bacterium]